MHFKKPLSLFMTLQYGAYEAHLPVRTSGALRPHFGNDRGTHKNKFQNIDRILQRDLQNDDVWEGKPNSMLRNSSAA